MHKQQARALPGAAGLLRAGSSAPPAPGLAGTHALLLTFPLLSWLPRPSARAARPAARPACPSEPDVEHNALLKLCSTEPLGARPRARHWGSPARSRRRAPHPWRPPPPARPPARPTAATSPGRAGRPRRRALAAPQQGLKICGWAHKQDNSPAHAVRLVALQCSAPAPAWQSRVEPPDSLTVRAGRTCREARPHVSRGRRTCEVLMGGWPSEVRCARLLRGGRPHAHGSAARAQLGAQRPRVEEELVQHTLQLHACAARAPRAGAGADRA